MKKTILLKFLSFIFLCFGIFACIEPYIIGYPIDLSIITVEATLSDENREQYISLRSTQPNVDKKKFYPITGAKIQLIINNSETVNLTEQAGKGEYYYPKGFVAKPTIKYKIRIQLPDNQILESSEETMTQSPAVDNINIELEPEGYAFGGYKFGSHYFYIDFKDPAGVRNNYIWQWRLYEKIRVCESCQNGTYQYISQTRTNACLENKAWTRAGIDTTIDYECDRLCWGIYYNDEINVASDALFDGGNVKNQLVAKVPFYQESGGLVEILHQTVSPNGFRYLKLLIQQGASTGTLADPPPAALIGNIKNITNPDQKIAGAFLLMSVKKSLHWLDRKDAIAAKVKKVGIPALRQANFEKATPSRPPLIPCLQGKFRTPTKPFGWID